MKPPASTMQVASSTGIIALVLVLAGLLASVPGVYGQTTGTVSSSRDPSLPDWLRVSPAPGTYAKNTELSFTGGNNLAFRISDRTPAGPYLTLPRHLQLSALPGEVRTYHIEFMNRGAGADKSVVSVSYTIDRAVPAAPTVNLPPDTYTGPRQVAFSNADGNAIYYRTALLPDGTATATTKWDGKSIELKSPTSGVSIVTVYAFSADRAGNRSGVVSWTYRLLPAPAQSTLLKIVSPVSGTFRNAQLLYVISEGYQDVRYTVDGTDPSEHGIAYTGPVTIPGTGNMTIRVSAARTGSGTTGATTESHVTIDQGNETIGSTLLSDGTVPRQGASLNAVSVPAPKDGSANFYVAAGEDPGPTNAVPFTEPISESPLPGSLTPFVVWIYEGTNGPSGTPFRYAYVLDGRRPGVPVINVDPAQSVAGVPLISIQSQPDSVVHYTLDGSVPNGGSPVYSGPFHPTLPNASAASPPDSGGQNTGSGTITVTAVATAANGSPSEPATASVAYDTRIPPAPRVAASEKTAASGVTLSIAGTDGSTVHYEVGTAGEQPNAVGPSSPLLFYPATNGPAQHDVVLDVPYGMETNFTLSLIAVSSFGVASRPVSVGPIRVDRQPPAAPSVDATPVASSAETTAPGMASTATFTVRGEGTVYYLLSRDGMPVAASGTKSDRGAAAYGGPVTVKGSPGIRTQYTMTAWAVDDLGNPSDRTTASIVLDNVPPVLSEIAGLSDGASYNDANIILTRVAAGTVPSAVESAGTDGGRATSSGAESLQLPDRTVARTAYVSAPNGSVVRYSLTTNSPAPDPTSASPRLDSQLTIATPENTDVTYFLKLAVDAGGGVTGPVRAISFRVDRNPPDAPKVSGISSGGSYPGSVSFSLRAGDEHDRLYFALAPARADSSGSGGSSAASGSTGGAPPSIVQPAHRYFGPVAVEAPPETERTFELRAAAEDEAGNVTELGSPFTFTISQLGLALPTLTWAPIDKSSDRTAVPGDGTVQSVGPILLFVAGQSASVVTTPSGPTTTSDTANAGGVSESAAGVRVEIGKAGASAPIPSVGSIPVGADGLPIGTAGAAGIYDVRAARVNSAGVVGPDLHFTLQIDPSTPVAPAPEVGDGYLAWPTDPSAQIWYSFEEPPRGDNASSATTGAPFTQYTDPIVLPAKNPPSTVWYFAVSPNDVKSGVRNAPLKGALLASSVPEPVIAGVADGGIYAQAVTLRNQTPGDGQVRYSISTDSAPSEPLGAFSPILPGLLDIDTPRTATVHYIVHAQTFSSVTGAVSAPVTIGFTIDHTPPATPVLAGAENGAYYRDGQQISLSVPNDPNATIYYRLTETSPSAPLGAAVPAQGASGVSQPRAPGLTNIPAGYSPYSGPIDLQAKSGAVADFAIETFAVDAAGNRSPSTATYHLSIDREVIYVAPPGSGPESSGKPVDGSRGHPYRGIAAAVKEAQASGRHTIFLASGTYELDEPLELKTDVAFVGGLDSATWSRASAKSTPSVIEPSASFAGDRNTLIADDGAAVSIANVDIHDGGRGLASVITQSSGSSAFVGSSITAAPGSEAILIQAGDLALQNSSVGRATIGTASTPLGPSRAASGLNPAPPAGASGKSDRSQPALVSKSGPGTLTIDSSMLNPGGGLRTVGLSLAGGKTVVSNSQILAGTGTLSATAVEIDASMDAGAAKGGSGAAPSLSLTNSSITAGSAAGSGIGIAASGADISLVGSSVSVAGKNSGVGISLRGGNLEVRQSELSAVSASDYLWLVSVHAATARITASILRGGSADDSLIVLAQDSQLALVQNTLLGAAGRLTNTGMRLEGTGTASVVNNLLLGPDAGPGTAIVLSGWNGDARLVTNAFGSWSRLISRESESGGDTFHPLGYRPPEISDVAQMNRLSSSGVSSSANVAGSYRDLQGTIGAGASFAAAVPTLVAGAPEIGAGSDVSSFGVAKDYTGAPVPRTPKSAPQQKAGGAPPAPSVGGAKAPAPQFDIGAVQFVTDTGK